MGILLLSEGGLCTAQAPSAERAGDVYTITISSETVTQTSDGSSNGSTEDQDALVERVIAVRPDGLELEYDLPPDATSQDRDIDWPFPARVLRSNDGQLELLNASDLQARADAWLRRAKLPKAACGHRYFTWNAFQVQCDPESVLATIERIDLRANVREGSPYRNPQAIGPGTVIKQSGESHGSSFIVHLDVDPAIIRQERAETDLVVAEVSGKPVTLDQARQAHAADAIAGTMTVRFDIDAAGRVQRRTTVTTIETKKPGGVVETRTATETIERRARKAAIGR